MAMMPPPRIGVGDGQHQQKCDQQNAAHAAQRTKRQLDPEPARNKAERAFINYFSELTDGTRNPIPPRTLAMRVGGHEARSQEENMWKFTLTAAAVAALAFSAPAFTTPALARRDGEDRVRQSWPS